MQMICFRKKLCVERFNANQQELGVKHDCALEQELLSLLLLGKMLDENPLVVIS